MSTNDNLNIKVQGIITHAALGAAVGGIEKYSDQRTLQKIAKQAAEKGDKFELTNRQTRVIKRSFDTCSENLKDMIKNIKTGKINYKKVLSSSGIGAVIGIGAYVLARGIIGLLKKEK